MSAEPCEGRAAGRVPRAAGGSAILGRPLSKKNEPLDVTATLPLDDTDSLRKQVLSSAIAEARRPMLVVVVGKDVGQRARVANGFTIGRVPGQDMVIADPRVSSKHCRIEDRGDDWVIVDLGSTNGVRVNGELVEEKALAPFDKVELGDTVLRFELQDAADQAYDEAVQRLLHVDDLTGLYVRRRFDPELDQMLREAAVAGEPVGLLVMDLDGLKAINDANGHLFGAYVISECGKVIGAQLPPGGIAARFGGDEYVAAARGLDLDATCALAERIRGAIAEHEFVREGVALHPGISIGAAAFPGHGRTREALFAQADAALYEAKRSGKNTVCRASD